eukprot:gene3574-4089_t
MEEIEEEVILDFAEIHFSGYDQDVDDNSSDSSDSSDSCSTNSSMGDSSIGTATSNVSSKTPIHGVLQFLTPPLSKRPPISRSNSTMVENHLYKKTYFAREELHNLYNLFRKDEISMVDFTEYIVFKGLSFLLNLPHGLDILTHLLAENDASLTKKSPPQSPTGPDAGEMESIFRTQLFGVKNAGVFGAKTLRDEEFSFINSSSLIVKWRHSELLDLVRLVDSLTVLNEFGYGNIGTPEEIVNNIFKESYSNVNSIQKLQSSGTLFKSGEIKENNVLLTHDSYLKRSTFNPDIPRCFGFFDLIYICFVKPIEDLNSTKPKSCAGYLYKLKNIGFLKYAYSLRYFECRNGFLIAYKRLSSKPSRVLCLFNTSVKVLPKEHPNHHGYPSILRKVLRTNTAKEIEESKDATDFVLEAFGKDNTYIALTTAKASLFVNTIRSNSRGSYRFHSFASPRDDIQVSHYINGHDYFTHVYHAIKSARSEIFIAGWCISPGISLLRDHEGRSNPEKYRLDKLLCKKASEGVKIYVLIWDETIIATDLGSRFVKSLFEKLHRRNIKVIRHPHLLPLSWSHHQKIVVVDQGLAFLGGMDLCYGRYDNFSYLLNDVEEKMFPGPDYVNSCIIKPKTNERICVIDRKNHPRIPWHDIAISLNGHAARDVAVNFIQRWNHAKNSNRDYKKYPYLVPSMEQPLPTTGTAKVQIVRSVCDWSAGQSLENSIYKAYINLINMSQHFIYIQNQFFISSVGQPQPNNQIAFAIFKSVDIDNYLSINSLRNWCVNGSVIFTEQVYVHSKVMIVDDRIAIIGSANINDRSLNGSRDSEICAVIEDKELSESRMNGQSYMAGSFAFKLRCQLWEGHLGYAHSGEPAPAHITHAIQDPIIDTTYFDLWRQTSAVNTVIYRNTFGTFIPENCRKISQYNRDGRLSSDLVSSTRLTEIQGYLIDFPFGMLQDEDEPSSVFSDIITGMKLFL